MRQERASCACAAAGRDRIDVPAHQMTAERIAGARLGSRLTRGSTGEAPERGLDMVSRDTSAKKERAARCAWTVRHTPCTLTLSPSAERPAANPAASIASSRSPPRSVLDRDAPGRQDDSGEHGYFAA